MKSNISTPPERQKNKARQLIIPAIVGAHAEQIEFTWDEYGYKVVENNV